ncbi:MAG: SbcC/MukB-like Walker B domain-containing protein [Clostridia bacterium]
MKKLTKIRLINWHNFVNETIEINNSFVLTGANATGKSTIIDAISLVLTANSRNFNKAANEKSSRDLKSYVRCKIGDESSTYLRQGSVVSFVALEFFDDIKKQNFVVGIKINSPDEMSSVTQKWFIKDCKLEDITFLNDNIPVLDNALYAKNDKIKLIDTASEANRRFLVIFGNLDPIFLKLLPMSIAFKNMDDIQDFIYNFVLEEKNIDTLTLRENLCHIKETEELLEEIGRELKKLDKILVINDEVLENEHKILVNKLVFYKSSIEDIENTILKNENTIKNNENKILRLQDEKKTLEYNERDLDDKLLEYIQQQKSMDSANLIATLERNLQDLRKNINEFTENEAMLDKILLNIEKNLKKLSQYKINLSFDKTMFYEFDKENEKIKKISQINEFKEQQFKIYNKNYYDLSGNIDALEKDLVQIEKDLAVLRKNKIIYPKSAELLKKLIQDEFKNRNIKSDVYIFCELLEISDPKWTNAIEGYLNNQRFYIIVDPKYYDLCTNVFNENREKLARTGLVNVIKVSNCEKKENTLSWYVKSDNYYIETYANYLLSRVFVTENVLNLKDFDISITQNCVLYQNYTLRNLNPESYKIPYIGKSALSRQLKLKEVEYVETKGKLTVLRDEYRKNERILEALKDLNTNDVEKLINTPKLKHKALNDFKLVEEEINDAKNQPDYIEISNKIENCKNQKTENKVNQESCIKVISNLENISNDLKNKNLAVEEIRKNYEQDFNKNSNDNQVALQKALENMSRNIKKNISMAEDEKKRLEKESISLNSSLNFEKNSFDGGNLGDIKNYSLRRDELFNVEKQRGETDLKKARDQADNIFRQDFVSKIGANITEANEIFNRYNKMLKNTKYGDEVYKFTYQPKKSKENIYKMLISSQNTAYEGLNLFAMQHHEEYGDEIQEMFDTLLSNKDAKRINEITDYRNYLDYDIEITNIATGIKRKFSISSKDFSGGESQVPYYVVISASFANLYQKGNTIKIIILDEAFSHMDAFRVESMLDFFKTLGFQFIISVPFDKYQTFGKKADSIIMTCKEGKRSYLDTINLNVEDT